MYVYIYIYIHMYIYIYICAYVYIYIYTHIQRVLLIVEGMTLLQTLQDFATPSGLTGSIWKTELEQIQKRKPGETAKLQFNLKAGPSPMEALKLKEGTFRFGYSAVLGSLRASRAGSCPDAA